LREVTRRFWAAGGRVFDTSPLYGMAEVNVGQFASALGINDKMFVSNKLWATGEYLEDDRAGEDGLRLSRERLWRDKIDLMLCHSLVNVDVMVPLMHAWKKEGRIRYLGVTHYELPYFEALAQWVEKGDLDVVQVHYSIAIRQAEERMGVRRAHDHGMPQTRQSDVVAKAASAGQQPKILLAPHRLANTITRGAQCAHPRAVPSFARCFAAGIRRNRPICLFHPPQMGVVSQFEL
jgi:diketogulonate reductase-like aldo/keto reductase